MATVYLGSVSEQVHPFIHTLPPWMCNVTEHSLSHDGSRNLMENAVYFHDLHSPNQTEHLWVSCSSGGVFTLYWHWFTEENAMHVNIPGIIRQKILFKLKTLLISHSSSFSLFCVILWLFALKRQPNMVSTFILVLYMVCSLITWK